MANDVAVLKERAGLPIKQVIRQVNDIQHLLKEVMQEGTHYGLIPGVKNKSLFKAGAEKIGLMFRLAPSYEVRTKDLPGDHMTVQVKCTLTKIDTGQVWGEGLGMGSTMEAKYRYRAGEGEVTDKAVPKSYWDIRKSDPKKAQDLIGGPGFTPKKTDTGWFIAKKSETKVEYDNPADFFNTVIKMAKKRAHVDAIITATAASDIFTQDIEDPEHDDE